MNEKFRIVPRGSADSPLQVSLAGISRCDGSYRIQRKPMDLTVIEFVEAGHGVVEAGGRRCEPGPGGIYIIPPWTEHLYYSSERDPWVKYWCNLHGPFVMELMNLYGVSDSLYFPDSRESGAMLRQTVLSLWDLPDERIHDYLEQRIFAMIRMLARERKRNTPAPYSPATERILSFLRGHVRKPMPPLEEIAAAAGLSPSQTIRVFRRDTGMTPYHFLLKEKNDAATSLLKGTRQTVGRIASELGFRDEYYFSRQFRGFYGMSPRKYRQLHSSGQGGS